MLAEFLTGLSAAKNGLEVIKTIQEIKDESQIQQKIMELNSAILALQSSLYAVNTALLSEQAQRTELESELKNLKNAQRQFENYVLHKLPTGAFVYRFQPQISDTTPIHDICTNCYANGIKSILQMVKPNRLTEFLECPECHHQILIKSPAQRLQK